MHALRMGLAAAAVAGATLATAAPAYADLCDGVDLVTSRVGYCTYDPCRTVWVDPFKDLADEGMAVSVCDLGARGYVCVANGRQYFCVLE